MDDIRKELYCMYQQLRTNKRDWEFEVFIAKDKEGENERRGQEHR